MPFSLPRDDATSRTLYAAKIMPNFRARRPRERRGRAERTAISGSGSCKFCRQLRSIYLHRPGVTVALVVRAHRRIAGADR